MDYVLGSVAALITGNVTPNRPKFIKRALTPTKHQPSPNVTPKSEFVEDRSIFLSPSMQKKKAIVKKSPKRIFQNPELENNGNGEGNLSLTSPKADKVKKHLEDELDADSSLTSQKSPKKKGKNKREATSTQENNVSVTEQNNEQSTPKNISSKPTEIVRTEVTAGGAKSPKKRKQRHKPVANTDGAKENDTSGKVNEPTPNKSPQKQDNKLNTSESSEKTNVASNTSNNATPKKKKNRKRRKSKANKVVSEITENKELPETTENKEVPESAENKDKESKVNIQKENQVATKKKNRRRKKSKGPQNKPEKVDTDEPKPVESDNEEDEEETAISEGTVKTSAETNKDKENQIIPKKKNRRRKKSKGPQNKPEKVDTDEPKPVESDNEEDEEETAISEGTVKTSAETNKDKENQIIPKKKNRKRKKSKGPQKPEKVDTDEPKPTESDDNEDLSTAPKSTVNPNAVTDKESDSEHESDDEIESENEEINKKVLESEKPEESSDEEDDEPKAKRGKKETKEGENTEGGEEKSTEEEIKRTLFVGNVPFSLKDMKELKKIFNKHGQIETIRIRTVPIKDARSTPKLAVIKNELHPERNTVNVYIKYVDEESVKKALVENNTVLNEHHLRVDRSSSTGAEHDPKCSVFIGNMPFAMEDEILRQKFEKCGEIQSVRIIRDVKTNAGKGFGYVNFESKDAVELALALSEEDLAVRNRILRVKRVTTTTSKKKPVKDNTGQKHSGYKGGNHQPKQQGGGFNNQANQQGGGFRGNQGNQQGGFRGNQGNQRGGFRGNQGNQQRGFRSGNDNNQQRGGNEQGFQQRNGPPSRNNQGNRQRAFGAGNDQQRGGFNNKFGGQKNLPQKDEQGREGAHRRVMNKRKNEENAGGSDAPPNKKQKDINKPNREKKIRKEFVGMTAEKKKKHKFDKGQKKKKTLSEILTK